MTAGIHSVNTTADGMQGLSDHILDVKQACRKDTEYWGSSCYHGLAGGILKHALKGSLFKGKTTRHSQAKDGLLQSIAPLNRLDFLFDLRPLFTLGDAQVIVGLQIHPELRRGAEIR